MYQRAERAGHDLEDDGDDDDNDGKEKEGELQTNAVLVEHAEEREDSAYLSEEDRVRLASHPHTFDLVLSEEDKV
jgi:hypothetical protein